jgi:hypothetical protein
MLQIETKYDAGLVCMNGHIVNSMSRSNPGENAKFCDKCGEPTIDACETCHAVIRGYSHSYGPRGSVGCSMTLPMHCYECGKPMPWTQRKTDALAEAIEWMDDLTDTDKDTLIKSIPDVIKETPRTDTAIAIFKKAIGKAGAIGGKLLTDVLSKVAAEVVVKSMHK